jgi:hypothetical protein
LEIVDREKRNVAGRASLIYLPQQVEDKHPDDGVDD